MAWGGWDGGGMAEGAPIEIMGPRGMRLMPPDVAAEAMAAAIASADTVVTVADVDWAWWAETFTIARPSPLISEIPAIKAASTTPATEGPDRTAWRAQMADLPAEQQRANLIEMISTEVAGVLKIAGGGGVEPDRPFIELGFDSLTAIELRDRLKSLTGLALPSAVAMDYPTGRLLAEHVGELMAEEEQPRSAASPGSLSIASLYRAACTAGRFVEANEMAMAAARLRPTFGAATEMNMTRPPVKLASGSDPVVLIGIPATSPLSGEYEFSRMARHFEGKRDLWVLPLPGFHDGENLPETWEVFVEMLTATPD